jgi:hypothetical protein
LGHSEKILGAAAKPISEAGWVPDEGRLTLSKTGNVVPIDFSARGYLEKYRRQRSRGYNHVMDGTLKELIEYTCVHNRGPSIDLFRITVGTNRYAGRVIRYLFHSSDFPKSSKQAPSLT